MECQEDTWNMAREMSKNTVIFNKNGKIAYTSVGVDVLIDPHAKGSKLAILCSMNRKRVVSK